MRTYSQEVKDKEVLDFVRRMANMAEYREPETVYHRERVRTYCLLIANSLGLSVPDAEIIANASVLHDVGKVGLPDELIQKTGDLTPYEWEVMKRHTTIGASVLNGSTSAILQAGEIIALNHHERWDGSGYPNQLKGEAIPMSARICSVADVFDALTSRRAYKQALPLEDAFRLIRDASGTLFDPLIVKAFLENKAEVSRVYSSSQSRQAAPAK